MAKQDKTSTVISKKNADKKDSTTLNASQYLAVPTDLKSSEVENVVNAVNPLIADAFAL